MGPVTAVKIAQESINYLDKTQIEEDGKVGPQTLSRINYWSHFDPETFVKVLNGFQFMRYVKIREEDPSQVANARGWMKRIQDYHDSDKW